MTEARAWARAELLRCPVGVLERVIEALAGEQGASGYRTDLRRCPADQGDVG